MFCWSLPSSVSSPNTTNGAQAGAVPGSNGCSHHDASAHHNSAHGGSACSQRSALSSADHQPSTLAPTENVFLVQLVNPVLFVKARVPADTVEQNNAPGLE